MTPCDSYLFPGSIYLMWPQLNSNVPVSSVVSIENAPAMRIDFAEGLSSDDNFFSAADCTLYGDDPVAVKFCLGDSNVQHGSLKAGMNRDQLIFSFHHLSKLAHSELRYICLWERHPERTMPCCVGVRVNTERDHGILDIQLYSFQHQQRGEQYNFISL